jgi:lipopolysaccharide/colanic/teichoic acid biosynthesis glycosyltransferase
MLTPRQVQIAVHTERARADRMDGEFSLVLFDTDAHSEKASRVLAGLLLQRARKTDTVGWSAPKRPCAILPHTSLEGACAFGENVREIAVIRGIRARYAIFTYPSNWLDSDPASDPRHGRLPANAFGSRTADQCREAPPVPKERVRHTDRVEPLEALFVRPVPTWKRLMDIAGALVGLILFAPVLWTAAAAIWLTSGRPIFFSQKRAGLGGRPFDIYKFRTMVPDAERHKAALKPSSEQDGPAFKIARDPRVTPLGRFLRRSSIDELPQLWNVLRGDMSLVGPRPLPLDEARACETWQRQRLDVTPGLTCIWQVRGRSRVSFNEWMRMDMAYIRRRRLVHDLKLLVQTLPAIFRGKGAH